MYNYDVTQVLIDLISHYSETCVCVPAQIIWILVVVWWNWYYIQYIVNGHDRYIINIESNHIYHVHSQCNTDSIHSQYNTDNQFYLHLSELWRQNSNYLLWYRDLYFTALSYLYLCSHFHLCTCDAFGFYSISSIQYISMKRNDDIQFNKKRYKSTNCKPVYLQKQNQFVTVVQVRKLLGENNNKWKNSQLTKVIYSVKVTIVTVKLTRTQTTHS